MSERQLLDYPCLRYEQDTGWRDFTDVITPEEAVTLHWPGRERTLWAFPTDLAMLALGHALIEWCSADEEPVMVSSNGRSFVMEPSFRSPTRENIHCPPMDAQTLLAGMKEFLDLEGRWDHTGCFHRMAVYDRMDKAFIHRTEDIGRHNCIDRVSGWTLANRVDPACCALFISARATASLVDKIIRAGFRFVISRSAVTRQAIELASEHSMTLVGFTRVNRFTLFTDSLKNMTVPTLSGDTP